MGYQKCGQSDTHAEALVAFEYKKCLSQCETSQLREEVSTLEASLERTQEEGQRAASDMDEERNAWRLSVERLAEEHRAEVGVRNRWV